MATGWSETTSDEIFNFKCTPCAALNKPREAVKYCVECQGYCCQSCVEMHTVVPALKGHNLKDNSNLKSTLMTTGLPAVPTETCATHEIKIMDMYCGNHDVVGCTSCIVLDHRDCVDVHSIPDIIDTVFKTTDADRALQKLQSTKTELETLKTKANTQIEELKKSKEESVKQIRQFRRELEQMLDALEKASLKELSERFKQIESSFRRDIDDYVSNLSILKQSEKSLLMSEGNKAQQFVSMKKLEKEIIRINDGERHTRSTMEATSAFTPDASMKKFLQQHTTLGTVKCQAGVLKPRTDIYRVQSVAEMNIKLTDDSNKTCYMYGSCLTQDGMLLLADQANQKLKRADINQMKVSDYCSLPDIPFSVCNINQHEAAVTLNNNTIQFITLGNQLKATRQLKTNHFCFGIAYKDDRLYITDNSNSLYIHDITGQLLQTVSTDRTGSYIFQNSCHITFSDIGDKVFVTGWSSGLITLDKQGGYISSFQDKELQSATGVCTDGRGNIFVCGCASKNVLQLGQDGKKIGEVVKMLDGKQRPYSLCFEPNQCRLVVTQENSNSVKIFSLK